MASTALALTLLFSLFTLAGCLSGCLSRPALKQQTFSFNSPSLAATNSVAGQPVLAIKKLNVASPFDDRALVYRTGEFTYARDPYAAFLDSPAQDLLAPLRAGLSSQGDFSAVVETGSALKPGTLVEINISQLYGDFRRPDQAQAVLTMRFTFFAATNGIVTRALFQKEYSRALPISSPSAAALMQGWNQALTEILDTVLSDYRQAKTGESADQALREGRRAAVPIQQSSAPLPVSGRMPFPVLKDFVARMEWFAIIPFSDETLMVIKRSSEP